MRPAAGTLADRDLEVARLRALIRRLEAAPPTRSRRAPEPPLALEPVTTPHGVALRHVTRVSMPEAVGDAGAPAPGAFYLDTETTGLAGGTGTYVFLIGLATWTGPTLTVTQYFLGDLDGEAALLHAVAEAVSEARQLVTFNGRTFDLPLLETRYLLARRPWWGVDLAHQDLYPVARALWRDQVPDCRLITLESVLLDLDRGDDLPGAFVPQLYFRYLRVGDARPLPRIFTHNRWDLVALAALAGRVGALLDGPDPDHDPREWLGAARWLERRDPPRSVRFYQAAVDADLGPPLLARAARRLGYLWRRAGRIEAALAVLARVAASLEGPPLGLMVDLAKLLEHHARDYEAALQWARRATRWGSRSTS